MHRRERIRKLGPTPGALSLLSVIRGATRRRVQPRTLAIAVSDGVAVADGGAVLLNLAPAVARSSATLVLTVPVRDLTIEEQGDYSLMLSGAKGGLPVGTVLGTAAGYVAGDPWLVVVGMVGGPVTGALAAVTLHDHPGVRAAKIGAVRLAKRVRRLIR